MVESIRQGPPPRTRSRKPEGEEQERAGLYFDHGQEKKVMAGAYGPRFYKKEA